MIVYVISHQQKIRSLVLVDFLNGLDIPFEKISEESEVNRSLRIGNLKIAKNILNREMTLNEFSCATAHLKALAKFLESSHESALILEDDALPVGDFSEHMSFLGKSRGACFVQLHTNIKPVFENIKRLRLLQPMDGAYAYLVNRDAAKKILHTNNITGICVPSDWHFPPVRSLRIYASVNASFAHPNSRIESYIQPERGLLEALVTKPQSGLRRRLGLDDLVRSRALKLPFRNLFEFRLRNYIQEIWIKKCFAIEKAFGGD